MASAGTRKISSDIAAMMCVIVALGSSSLGIAIGLGVAVELVGVGDGGRVGS